MIQTERARRIIPSDIIIHQLPPPPSIHHPRLVSSTIHQSPPHFSQLCPPKIPTCCQSPCPLASVSSIHHLTCLSPNNPFSPLQSVCVCLSVCSHSTHPTDVYCHSYTTSPNQTYLPITPTSYLTSTPPLGPAKPITSPLSLFIQYPL